MASKEEYFPGPRCKNVNITIEGLTDGDVPKLSHDDFTKGILCELNQHRKANDISWEEFYDWIIALTEETVPKLVTLKVTLSRLDKTCAKYKRNKQQDKLELLMDESMFSCKEQKTDLSSKVTNAIIPYSCSYEVETLKKVNVDLASELQESEAALIDQKLKVDELSSKLSKLNIRNANKKLKRRDNKIKDSQCCIDNLTKEVEAKSATIAKLENRLELAQQGKECIVASLIDVLSGPVHQKLLVMKSNVNLLYLKKNVS